MNNNIVSHQYLQMNDCNMKAMLDNNRMITSDTSWRGNFVMMYLSKRLWIFLLILLLIEWGNSSYKQIILELYNIMT